MRILHTSDWHLGRSFHGVQLLDAQVQVLDAIVEMVREESIDVVTLSGDVYDRAMPSGDAVAALSELLGRIRAAGAVVVGMSGNHDSAVRLSFAEPLLSNAGVTLRGDLATIGKPVIVPERDGSAEVAFYPIPYLEPEVARHQLGDPDARSHDRLLKLALDRARLDLAGRSVRSVALVHAFVTGGESSDSELPLAVGGSGEVALSATKGFDYVALGHLHGRQSLGSGRARYSGSPLAYSFSERNHRKGVWIVDLPAIGEMTVTPVDLPVYRTLHQLRGSLDSLLSSSEHDVAHESFVHAVITDPMLPVEAMSRLQRRFPHAVVLTHEPPVVEGSPISYSDRVEGRTDLELACDFIEHVSGEPADEHDIASLSSVIEEQLSPGRESAA